MLSILLLPQTILILAAIIPAIFLLIKVYKSDKLEKEDPRFILLLLISGIISIICFILGMLVSFFMNLPTGASIVLIYIILLLITKVVKKVLI